MSEERRGKKKRIGGKAKGKEGCQEKMERGDEGQGSGGKGRQKEETNISVS